MGFLSGDGRNKLVHSRMRKANNPIKDFVQLFSYLPWWITSALAWLTYYILHLIAVEKPIVANTPAAIGAALSHMVFTVFATAGQFVVPGILLVAAAIDIISRIAPLDFSLSDVPQFTGKPLLTDNEAEFYGRLLRALPAHRVHPQVAMSALITPKARHGKAHLAAFRRISQKVVDYVVMDGNDLVCIIELDDATHSAARDKQRDAMTSSAGIRTVRFQSRNKPAADEIRRTILGTNATECSRNERPDRTPHW